MKDIFVQFLQEQGFFNDVKIVEPEDEVGKDENKIGDMNALEKFLYSKLGEVDNLCLDFHSKPIHSAEEEENHQKLHGVKEIAKELLFFSIQSRMKKNIKASGLGVRKGFVVVEMYDANDPGEFFAKMMSNLGGMVVISSRS